MTLYIQCNVCGINDSDKLLAPLYPSLANFVYYWISFSSQTYINHSCWKLSLSFNILRRHNTYMCPLVWSHLTYISSNFKCTHVCIWTWTELNTLTHTSYLTFYVAIHVLRVLCYTKQVCVLVQLHTILSTPKVEEHRSNKRSSSQSNSSSVFF